MGIGGSRGGSRVVNPIGSNPNGAPAAGFTGASPSSGTPAAVIPVSTRSNTDILGDMGLLKNGVKTPIAIGGPQFNTLIRNPELFQTYLGI